MPPLRSLLLILGALALALPTSVLAADIPRLEGPVTDRAGVLDGQVDDVEAALADLLDDQGIQLFVLFVDTTAELTVTEFADETARVNSLGADDALLVVAIEDRTDAIWISDRLDDEITDRELDEVISGTLEPALRDGDFAAAAIATAVALGEAATLEVIPTSAPTPRATEAPSDGGGGVGGGGEGDGGGLDLGLIVGLILVAGGVIILGTWLLSRVGAWREAEERDRRTGKLAREANAMLIAVDERIRTADQEAGFVEAEYGEAEAAPFRTAIGEAREALRAAFGIRQKLDDAEPEDPPTREAMLTEILEHGRRAGAALDRQAARIDELRNLERNAPTILAALPAQLEAQARRLPKADALLGELNGFAPSTWAAVHGNVTEASKGLAGAGEAIRLGQAQVAAANGRKAARQIVVAQDGIAGASGLLDAVEKLAGSARDADARLGGEIDAARVDLEAARRAAAGLSDASSEHAAPIRAAGEALRAAEAAADARPRDPLAASKLGATARAAAAEVLAAIRADAAQQAQLAAALAASIASAQADVDRAADFIATRRSGVGRRARTRLAEADRLLEAALNLRQADPKAAMNHAREAERRAEEAYSLAATDFDGWNRGGHGPSRGGGGSDVAGAILGGIIGGILSGGGRRGGGWGGSPWGSSGSPGGGGGWGGGGGHSSGGGFGGGGGGGGHSRGGRW